MRRSGLRCEARAVNKSFVAHAKCLHGQTLSQLNGRRTSYSAQDDGVRGLSVENCQICCSSTVVWCIHRRRGCCRHTRAATTVKRNAFSALLRETLDAVIPLAVPRAHARARLRAALRAVLASAEVSPRPWMPSASAQPRTIAPTGSRTAAPTTSSASVRWRDRPGQREGPEARVVLRSRHQARPGSDAAGRRRHDVRHFGVEQSVRARRAHRQGEVALRSAGRRRQGDRCLLRRRESRRRGVGPQRLRRHARRPAHRARHDERQAAVVGADHRPEEALHDHRRAARHQGQGHHRQRRRRDGRARLRVRVRRDHRQDALALLHRARQSAGRLRESAAGARREDVARRMVEVRRRRHRVGFDGLRSAARHSVRRRRQRQSLEPSHPLQRRGRQPVPVVDPRAEAGHRRIRVALPEHAGGVVGLHGHAAHHARGPDDRRPAAQGRDAGAEERLLLRARSRHRRVHLGARTTST